MKKSLLAVLAALIAFVMCFSSCTKEDKTNVSYEDVSSFEYFCELPVGIASVYDTLAEMDMYKEMEKRTGIKINFVHPPAGQIHEQVHLILASRDFPDLMEYRWATNYSGGPDKAVQDNVLLDLTEMIEEHAPNFSALIKSNKDYERLAKSDGGLFYAMPGITISKYDVTSGLMIRKDWLDELGLEIPETIDEWETVLTAFKEKKGADAPYTMINTSFETYGPPSFCGAFNVGMGFYVDDDIVKFGPMEDNYIDFIAKMRDWYKKGLIDKNYSTNNTSILDSNMTSGKSGACYGYIGSYMGKYLSAMEGTGFDLVATPFPVIKKGDKTNFAVINPIGVGVSSLGITPACKNPVKAVEWADNWYSLEGAKLKMFGVEGNTYNMVDGKPVYTDKIMNNPEGLSVSEAMNRSFRTGSMPALFSEEFEKEYFDQFYSYQQQKDALELYSSYSYTKKSVMPFVSPTVEESEEFAAISADIGTYVSEMINKFICGDKPIEEYDDFRDNLKKMNVERYIELRQAAYDRYLKR